MTTDVTIPDLSDADLADLERRYGDSTPKSKCRVCGAIDWLIRACGRGRVTWACRASLPVDYGGTGAIMDLDHYGKSSHEKASGDDRIATLVAEVRRRRSATAPRVLAQIIRAPSAGWRGMTGIRLIVDGEVIDTGQYGGEPEDNYEYRDYKWVKDMLILLARKLGATASIESVEVDGSTERAASEAYYAAMAAKPDGGP